MRGRVVFVLAIAVVLAVAVAATGSARVLRVGSYRGIPGQYGSIQAAVDAARPYDTILIGPGDYKTRSSRYPPGVNDFPAGILVTTPDLTIRGMNRNTVIVDGTKPGSSACSRKQSAQNFGPAASGGPAGLNGVMVWKADDVTVQNLTVCNFLGGALGDGHTGNEIWWNGGADSGTIGGWGYYGTYMTATSTFYNGESTAAEYGIFSSNWDGGTWNQSYASNFNDSGYYIGACQQQCNQTISRAWAEYNALGYSGTNSGGQLVVENSQFDNNEDGFDTNSQNADEPSPQNGACPDNGVSSITHTHSCWVFIHNYSHDNNNPNVPSSGSAAAGPVGTGMSISGARNDTIMDNRFARNNAWGVIFVPYSDEGPPCIGGTLPSAILGDDGCLFDEWGDALLNNRFSKNGGYGNPTNGDFDQLNFETHPTNCFSGNTNKKGLSSGAVTLEQTYPVCTGEDVAPNINIPFLNEVLCDSQVSLPPFGCQPGDNYPRRTTVIMHPLPRYLPTMPNPCAGVPSNPWCKSYGRPQA